MRTKTLLELSGTDLGLQVRVTDSYGTYTGTLWDFGYERDVVYEESFGGPQYKFAGNLDISLNVGEAALRYDSRDEVEVEFL